MNCYVCGTGIGAEEDHCPCCGEYVVDIIGDNPETEKILTEKGEKRRVRLLSQYELQISVYQWADGASQKMRIPLSTAEKLYHTEGWLEECFARDPGSDELNLELALLKNGEENTFTVKLQSFQSPTFLHIGAVIEDGFKLKLLLKNDSGEIHRSETVELLKV